MKVLVAVASKHGSTQEIAFAIGKQLGEQGLDVEVKNVQNIESLADYEAVVLGSAIYAGRWLGEARDFVDDFESELVKRPVWLFSSGPVGRKLNSEPGKTVKIGYILDRINPNEHKVFAGKLKPCQIGIIWRPIMHAAGAEGDFRDWDDIRLWSDKIARQLVGKVAV